MNSGGDDDKGWRFQCRKKKGIKYSVKDFLKHQEKEIKAERIEEEEERAYSEASAGAKTGVSDLVPTLNLVDEDPIVVSDDTDDGTTAEVLPNLGSTGKVSGDVVEGGGILGHGSQLEGRRDGDQPTEDFCDNKKILSRKNGNSNEEIRRFYVKKKDIENKKQNNYVASEYKSMMMMMKRKKYDMIKEKEKDTKMSKEFNKTSLKKLTSKYLRVISFKHKVRKQYRGSCKGNVVAYPPLRDNG